MEGLRNKFDNKENKKVYCNLHSTPFSLYCDNTVTFNMYTTSLTGHSLSCEVVSAFWSTILQYSEKLVSIVN